MLRLGSSASACLLLALTVFGCGDDSSDVVSDSSESGADSAGETDADSTTSDSTSSSGTSEDTGDTVTSGSTTTGSTGEAEDTASDSGSEGTGTESTGDSTGEASGSESSGSETGTAGTTGGVDTCHEHALEVPEVQIETVPNLPTMTGGDIPLGTYDIVAASTTGQLTGTIRSTWVFEDETTLQVIQQLALVGPAPEPTPRTMSYATSGATLDREESCPGTEQFSNEYRVRDDGDEIVLDVRQGGLMFTYQRRAR